MQVERVERMSDDGPGSFSHIAVIPIWDTEPVADFSTLVAEMHSDTDRAHQRPVGAVDDGPRIPVSRLSTTGKAADPRLGSTVWIRVRDIQRGGGDLRRASQY